MLRYSYNVWHSEEHKCALKPESDRVLDDDEVSIVYQNLEALVLLSYDHEPRFGASVVRFQHALRGVTIVLSTELDENEADRSIARCLVRINRLDIGLCFIAEPVELARA